MASRPLVGPLVGHKHHSFQAISLFWPWLTSALRWKSAELYNLSACPPPQRHNSDRLPAVGLPLNARHQFVCKFYDVSRRQRLFGWRWCLLSWRVQLLMLYISHPKRTQHSKLNGAIHLQRHSNLCVCICRSQLPDQLACGVLLMPPPHSNGSAAAVKCQRIDLLFKRFPCRHTTYKTILTNIHSYLGTQSIAFTLLEGKLRLGYVLLHIPRIWNIYHRCFVRIISAARASLVPVAKFLSLGKCLTANHLSILSVGTAKGKKLYHKVVRRSICVENHLQFQNRPLYYTRSVLRVFMSKSSFLYKYRSKYYAAVWRQQPRH